MKHELHPLCTLFPRLSGKEFESLCADIKENGLRNPIVVHEGMILDGGNRYHACIELGIKPDLVEFTGGNIVSFVLSANLHRRHLSPGQQAAIVASAQDWANAHTHGGDRKSEQSRLNDFDTVDKRAAASGVHRDTQIKADKVAKADPDLAKKVAHGEISLPKAVKQITPQKNKPKNSQEVEVPDDLEQINKELSHEIVSLEEENQKLRDAIAAGQLPDSVEIQTAEEIIIDLRKQVKNLQIELQAVKESRDKCKQEIISLKSQCASQAKQLKRLGVANNA